MSKNSMFIVIEGLDGSGKTSVSRQLTYFLQSSFENKVKLTFEPHDPSCGGLFIRQVLEKKITNFSDETLMLAFAANRMDHCDREINSWLKEDGNIVICDRYYLSSLVYQSSDEYPMEYVMDLNSHARKPDLIFFLDVSNEVCYERMDIRNKPRELFEENLSATRNKYYKAIDFLRDTKNENIVHIDASGTIEEVLEEMVKSIVNFKPEWKNEQLSLLKTFTLKQAHSFALNGHLPATISDILKALNNIIFKDKDAFNAKDTPDKFSFIESGIDKIFDNYDFNNLGSIFLDYIIALGYTLGSRLPGTQLDTYELSFKMPGDVLQRGAALLINESQKNDVVLEAATSLDKMTDFIFVFSPGPTELVTKYFERETIKYSNDENSLFPSVQMITENDLKEFVLGKFKAQHNLATAK